MDGIMASPEHKEHPGPGTSPPARGEVGLVPGTLRTLPLRRLPLDVARDGRESFMMPSRLRACPYPTAEIAIPAEAPPQPTTLEDLIGIEHSKLGFSQELRQKVQELREAHEESELRRQEIAAILDGITDIMMVLTKDLRIISVNHVFHELFNVPHPEGQHCYRLFRDAGRPCPECPAHRSFQSNAVCRCMGTFKIGGVVRQFEMVASPIHNPDSPESRILIFKRDVTMEQEYQAKYYQAEKMATIGMLAAGVAHEINNPLTAVYGLAEGIRRRLPVIREAVDDPLFGDVAEYTETILMECRRCRDIVRSMLSFSRPHTLAFSPVCLNEVVTDTLSILRGHLEERGEQGLRLTVNLFPNLPTVPGDEAQLKQVLLNILVNSMDAIDGEGEITITTHPENDNTVNLSVEDSGCGLPPENWDKLFNPFFTTKPVGKGIGIGLAACYGIVREHHGVIEVASEVGLGTHFTVKLPLDSGQFSE
ncbi:two-component system sensor histidine kinase NtrB [Solidesulfovibrio sp.]|uniref:two-component system sensor histidine kinase NtrB n=1 Tax=Solidesulfovibrio sp. TaxID=2910990 RepID=UPI002B1F5B07|nr:ATP-binding protein [Solidesulfovibrio sp.]MEA4855191.1 ATP-binding protein [Solidesulfovibrio sp.]